ncbi:MAG: RNA polymerase sigma factor [Anaerolineae bacterium]|nr:MAG: RNA polymerase sigma factor [Anaerolineae bacterium]WKZ42939.1 MAG: sigma-70 family RNA polymerase sigma factor [Anaerolineales bacterium]
MSNRTNEQWIAELKDSGPAREAALEDLRGIIQKGLPYALSRWLSPDQPQFNSLVEEVTQETLLRVLDQLGTFEGRSQFTTWVHKIAVRIALTELRRKRWRDSSLDELTENEDVLPPPGLLADTHAGPETSAERADMLARVNRIIEEELTDRQREALVLLGVRDMPMEDAARKLKTNRNALYKLLHDARVRLKSRLSREDIAPYEVLALFEQK